MKTFLRCILFTLLLCVGCAPALAQEQTAVVPAAHITILHTNDMHGRVLPEDDRGNSIGLPEIAAAVQTIRQQNPGTLLVDAGDTLHGMPEINISQGKNMAVLLDALGYDLMVPGNHDYNYGSARLQELARGMHCTVLSANTIDRRTKQPLFAPSKIIVRDGVRIAFFGITTPETANKTSPRNVKDIIFTDAIAAAREQVRVLRPQADLLIGIMHVGLDKSSVVTSDAIARAVPGIDVIIDGHSHTELPDGLLVGSTLIAQTGCYDHRLGRVDLTVQDKKVTAKTAHLYTPAELTAIAPQPDAAITARISQMKTANQALFAEVIAHSNLPLSGERALVRTRETTLGDLSADALRAAAQADIAIVNGGSIRTDLKAGAVTRLDMMSIFPFGNTLKKVEVSGAVLQSILEHSVSQLPAASGGFLQVSGLTFTYDVSQPAGQRVSDIRVAGKPLVLTRTYTLAANDFLTAGGDGYTMLQSARVIGEYGTCEEAMTSWLNQHGVTSQTSANRIQPQAAAFPAAA